MLRNCRLLNDSFSIESDKIIISTLTEFNYRLQKIVSLQGDILGFEVLLDFQRAQNEINDGLAQYTSAINDGRSLDFLLNILLTKKPNYFSKRIFINVERMNLCNKTLLRKVAAAARKLCVDYDVELVVEITERNPCGDCADILHGLVFLKRNKVSLAADDFDIYGDDFREKEVDSGIYDYIKVDMPKSISQARKLNEFICNRRERVIVEMVERHEEIFNLGVSNRAFGYQGFAYT